MPLEKLYQKNGSNSLHSVETKQAFIDYLINNHNIDFELPNYKIPTLEELDFSLVNNDATIRMFTDNLITFLKAPKINYMNVKNHEERRDLRDKLSQINPEYSSQVLTNDKMKLNKFSAFPMFIKMILEKNALSNNIKMKTILEKFPSLEDMIQYSQKNNTEKKFIIAEIENSGLEFIDLFRKKEKTTAAMSNNN